MREGGAILHKILELLHVGEAQRGSSVLRVIMTGLKVYAR